MYIPRYVINIGWNTHTLPRGQVFGEAEVLGVSKVGFRNRGVTGVGFHRCETPM